MKLTRADAGRIGGLITLERYGRDQLATWGKLGGRPKLSTYDEIKRQQLLLEQNNNKGVITDPPGSLTQLKRRWRLCSQSERGS